MNGEPYVEEAHDHNSLEHTYDCRGGSSGHESHPRTPATAHGDAKGNDLSSGGLAAVESAARRHENVERSAVRERAEARSMARVQVQGHRRDRFGQPKGRKRQRHAVRQGWEDPS